MLSNEKLLQTVLQGYEEMSALLKICSIDEIIEAAAGVFDVGAEQMAQYTMGICGKDKENLPYALVVEDLLRNIAKYDWVYKQLLDDISRETFTNLVGYRLVPDTTFLDRACADETRGLYEEKLSAAGSGKSHIMLPVSQDEASALLAMKDQIREEHPEISVCVHHVVSDIWEIPMLLDMMYGEYGYTIRHFRRETGSGGEADDNVENADETILYVIPPVIRKPKRIKRVVAMAPYERPWSNVELVKDCGLTPYLMYKNHGCDVSMAGAPGGEYPYASLVEGMKLEALKSGSLSAKKQYIAEHGEEIDCLLLRGCYGDNLELAPLYKKVNPEGRIYVGLDANSRWMDRIHWDDRKFKAFMDCCDVVGTSCTAMQTYLNEKWPWNIRCIPNGFYDFDRDGMEPLPFAQKENIILTVGRLGTRQKATEVLLDAFASIREKIPDWSLRLVGSIEEPFKPQIDEFFMQNPQLKERVVFTGPIQDRRLLREEYRRAKIFALSSALEGGAPNVISEALNAGCVMAMTKIDAYEDAIGGGACGKAVDVGDKDGFAQILLELCACEELEALSERALAHGRDFYDMEKIVGGLYEQLCL